MFARRIAVVGTGYVGLTTGACLASLGHRVVCADVDAIKVERLRAGDIGIREDGLAELVNEGVAAGRLSFVVGAGAALKELEADGAPVEVMFLCVPTPMGVGGIADLNAVEAVIEETRAALPPGCVVVNKSTVPVGTAARTAELLERDDVGVVSNPEFLREGSAVRDFLNPDRIVVGSSQQDAAERVAALYARLGAPTVLTDAASAEMIKYAANCFLAMKLSYVNAMAELCERLDADIADVTEGIGYDKRIGQAFLSPGPGWGGSCLPKDTHALLQVADAADFEFRLLRATIDTNTRQFQRMVDKIRTGGDGKADRLAVEEADRAVRADVQGRHGRPARLAGAGGGGAAEAGRGGAGRLRPRHHRRRQPRSTTRSSPSWTIPTSRPRTPRPSWCSRNGPSSAASTGRAWPRAWLRRPSSTLAISSTRTSCAARRSPGSASAA